MGAGVFHSHSALRFPTFSSFSKSSLSLKEVAVGLPSFVPQKGFNEFTISNIRSDGDKRGQSHQRKRASRRTGRGDENKGHQIFDGKKSKSSDDLEEIIALFRRIQSSISKGDSQSTNKTSYDSDNDKPSAESILDVLRESGKQVTGKFSNGEKDKAYTKARSVSRKKQEVPKRPQVTSFNLTRPPTKFEKKSPIPSLSAPRGKVLELNDEASPATLGDKQIQSHRLERMKLPELKELAKSRNIKGYSKLKKSELIEILGHR